MQSIWSAVTRGAAAAAPANGTDPRGPEVPHSGREVHQADFREDELVELVVRYALFNMSEQLSRLVGAVSNPGSFDQFMTTTGTPWFVLMLVAASVVGLLTRALSSMVVLTFALWVADSMCMSRGVPAASLALRFLCASVILRAIARMVAQLWRRLRGPPGGPRPRGDADSAPAAEPEAPARGASAAPQLDVTVWALLASSNEKLGSIRSALLDIHSALLDIRSEVRDRGRHGAGPSAL